MKEFIVDHYLFIMIVAAFLIFALIGYIIDSTKNNKKDENKKISEEENILLSENTIPEVQEVEPEVVVAENVVELSPSEVETNDIKDTVEPVTKKEAKDFVLADNKEEIIVEMPQEDTNQKDNK